MANPAVLEMPAPQPAQEQKKEKARRDRGTGRVYQRGNTWWIAYHVRGIKVRESSHSSKKTVAIELLKTKLVEAQQNGYVAPARLTYDQLRESLYDDYETRGHKSLLRRAADDEERGYKKGDRFLCTVSPALDDFFTGYKAEAITIETIKAFIRKRQKEGLSNSCINGSLAALRRMFWLQVEEKRFPTNAVPHFPMLPPDPPRTDFLSDEEYRKVLAELHSDSKPLLTVAYHCGARRGELLKLRWEDVDLKAGIMTFRDTKNGTDRAVPILGAAGEALGLLRAAHPESELVFVRADGEPIKTFRKAWLAALRRAGIEGTRHFHGLRRGVAVNLMAAGVDSQLARKITGHRDPRTFEGYRVLLQNDILHAGKVLEKHLEKNGHSYGHTQKPRRRK